MRQLSQCRRGASALVLAVLVAGALGLTATMPARAQDRAAIDRLLFEAERQQREGDWESAERNYELLVQQFPATESAAEALLLLAQGRLQVGDRQGAREAAEKLTREHPRSPRAAGGFVLLGEMAAAAASTLVDLEEARASFQNVVVLFGRELYPGLTWRSAAGVRSGDLARLVGKDGGVKRRSDAPVAMQTIFDQIDQMPMRRAEMRPEDDPSR